jgi:hypothetical protein
VGFLAGALLAACSEARPHPAELGNCVGSPEASCNVFQGGGTASAGDASAGDAGPDRDGAEAGDAEEPADAGDGPSLPALTAGDQ